MVPRNSTKGMHTMAFTIRWATACLVLAAATSLVAQKTPDEALRALQDGNRRFATDKSVPQPVGEGVRRTLARGQSPMAIVLCCADSRVPPEHVFNAGLGEIFVVRVAGHTCDPETLASIEYAVDHLNVPLCVVMGHEGCGAVGATIAQVEAQAHEHPEAAPSQSIQQLLEAIEPAVRKVQMRDLGGKERSDACEEEHAQLTVSECLRRSPMLRRYAQVGKFKMVAARYHLQSGEVEWLPNRPLPAEPGSTAAGAHKAHAAVPTTVPPHVALRMLQAGHRRFLGDGLQSSDLSGPRREQLTHGQRPLAIVLTCADSRVAPEHVFDAGLGELFVIRVAGNAINDDVLASIEYAASHTGASLLVVMGHTRCGALTAAAQHPEGHQLSTSMRALLARLEPSVEKVRRNGQKGPELVELAIRANVQRAVAEARSRSAILRELEHAGNFAMLPVVYDIASGDVTWLKDAGEAAPSTAAATTVPAAAPAGETSHGKSHPAHAEAPSAHDEPDARHGAAPKAAAAGAFDWANGGDAEMVVSPPNAHHGAPGGHMPDNAHGEASAHGAAAHEPATGHDGDDHDEHGSHDAAAEHADAHGGDHGHDVAHGEDDHAHGSSDAHGHAAHDTHAADAHGKEPSAWSDPIVIVGIGGVASLLLAALVAMLKK